eukprot:CAMPEP_0184532088 /NCGR_PEP_ID=MMETSP0198_2-20121128/13948_1 /TAXON_ID=1112570 /ORGANISM="Thraustochytrium sp., Strain LLF1b" /LENGTH=116 /DNA_ID=CAMNT_0026924597 /DNA_START=282 /DNA_END=629 /DNA_ORIENTATION=-
MMNKVNVLLACSAAALSARLAQGGSCYLGAPSHEVFCAVDEAVCNSVEGRFWYEEGNIGSVMAAAIAVKVVITASKLALTAKLHTILMGSADILVDLLRTRRSSMSLRLLPGRPPR